MRSHTRKCERSFFGSGLWDVGFRFAVGVASRAQRNSNASGTRLFLFIVLLQATWVPDAHQTIASSPMSWFFPKSVAKGFSAEAVFVKRLSLSSLRYR